MKQIKLKLIPLITLVLILSISLIGCQSKDLTPSETSPQTNADEKFSVVTSFYPLYIFTENVMDGAKNVELRNLTEAQTGCLHDYQMKPSDMVALEGADLFIINGAGMESFLDQVHKAYPNLKIIEASTGIHLITDAAGTQNPHVWVSVTNAMAEIKNITTALVSENPENASVYKAKAEAYLNRLNTLSTKMHTALTPFAGEKIVTFHEAFPYFAQEFNFEIAAVIEREPGSEPTAKELEETITIVKASGVKSLFSEPQYSNRSADVISHETGATVYVLDPFVTGTTKDAPDAYEKTMEKNLAVLIDAFSSKQ